MRFSPDNEQLYQHRKWFRMINVFYLKWWWYCQNLAVKAHLSFVKGVPSQDIISGSKKIELKTEIIELTNDVEVKIIMMSNIGRKTFQSIFAIFWLIIRGWNFFLDERVWRPSFWTVMLLNRRFLRRILTYQSFQDKVLEGFENMLFIWLPQRRMGLTI